MRRHPWTAALIDCRRRPSTVLALVLVGCLVSLAAHWIDDTVRARTGEPPAAAVSSGIARFADAAAPLADPGPAEVFVGGNKNPPD